MCRVRGGKRRNVPAMFAEHWKNKIEKAKKKLIDVKLKLKYECQKIAEVKYTYSIKGERETRKEGHERSLGLG